MPVQRDNENDLLNVITKLVNETEDQHKNLPFNDRMFSKKFANYADILKSSMPSSQKLEAIYKLACGLADSHDPKYNWTTIHQEIKDKIGKMFANKNSVGITK